MGLFSPTTHLAKRHYTTFLGTKKVETFCGEVYDATGPNAAEPGTWSPGWVAGCGKCSRKSGVKWK